MMDSAVTPSGVTAWGELEEGAIGTQTETAVWRGHLKGGTILARAINSAWSELARRMLGEKILQPHSLSSCWSSASTPNG